MDVPEDSSDEEVDEEMIAFGGDENVDSPLTDDNDV
jgi:hypothetical protein